MMSYENIIRGKDIIGKSKLCGFILLFIIVISSSSVFGAVTPYLYIDLHDGPSGMYTYYTEASPIYNPYTPNEYVSHSTTFDGGYSAVQVVANYGSIGVSATLQSDTWPNPSFPSDYNFINSGSLGVIRDSYTLTGGTPGSTVNMSLQVDVSGFIDRISYAPGTINSGLYITIQRFDGTTWISDGLYQQAFESEGLVSNSFLTPAWSYDIGKLYAIDITAIAGVMVTAGFAESSFIDTVSFPAVRIYADQTSGFDVTLGSGRELALNFNPETPPAPVPEPSTMLLLGSGLVGLVGYGRRRMRR